MARLNPQANRLEFPQWYAIVERIDCFVRAGKNLINPKPVVTGALLLRSQYAFKTAAGMARSGNESPQAIYLCDTPKATIN
ncbi:MAG: hypothetical protein WCF81_03435 [Roseiarcus sp.]